MRLQPGLYLKGPSSNTVTWESSGRVVQRYLTPGPKLLEMLVVIKHKPEAVALS